MENLENNITSGNLYDSFIEKYSDFPQYLAELIIARRDSFAQTPEVENYNLGTMQKDEDIGLSQNIKIANAHKFQSAYSAYKENNPQILDDEAKA